MSIRFAQGKLKGEERTSILQEIQRQAKAAALTAVKPVFTTFLEAEVTAKLGRGKRDPRHVSGQAREIDWQCTSCGSRDANQFIRDGHDRRDLETGWGHLDGVPRADAGMPTLWTRRDLERGDHGEVSTVLARFRAGCGVWQWLM